MKKLLTLVLAMVLVISMIPMAASAASYHWTQFEKIEINPYNPNGNRPYIGIMYDGTIKELSYAQYKELEEQYSDYLVSLEEQLAMANHEGNDHHFFWASNTKYHWLSCPCGCEINKEAHVDPKDAADDYCICGYKFSDNADLVTLWVNGCPPIKGFQKDTTEYTLKAYTYKDVKEIAISIHTFDSEATVELPEDLTLKAGENKFEIKVTSENQKVTKTYTLIINKEAK